MTAFLKKKSTSVVLIQNQQLPALMLVVVMALPRMGKRQIKIQAKKN
jgi:hypothetical protein